MFLALPCFCKVITEDAYFPFGMVPESVEKTRTYSDTFWHPFAEQKWDDDSFSWYLIFHVT